MKVWLIYKDKPSDSDHSWWLWDKLVAVSPTYEAAQSYVLGRNRPLNGGETLEWHTEDSEIRLIYRNDEKPSYWYYSDYYIRGIELQDSVVVVMEEDDATP